MFLPGKRAQTTLKRRSNDAISTLKWRSNDPGYILIKRDAQSLHKIACWKKHMSYVCFYLVNGLKRRSNDAISTLKWRSNDPGYILIKRDAQSCNNLT